MLLLVIVWVILEASPLNPRESLVRTALAYASPWDLVILLFAPVVLLAFSWKALTTGMWSTLMGRKWATYTVGIVANAIFGLVALAGYWVYKHPQYQPTLMSYIPWFVGTLLVVKLLVAAWLLKRLHERQLVSLQTIQISVAAWLAACVLLFGIVACFVTPTPTITVGVFLLVPLTRLTAAPLALNWNRHR